jgi:hypothetical protein
VLCAATVQPPVSTTAVTTRYWHLDKQHHREDGPAVELPSGEWQWYLNGSRHREDGPAIKRPDGPLEWWLNGKRHREDGPAVEWPDGTREWWLDGVQYESENEWLNDARLRRFAKVVVTPSARSRPSPLAG